MTDWSKYSTYTLKEPEAPARTRPRPKLRRSAGVRTASRFNRLDLLLAQKLGKLARAGAPISRDLDDYYIKVMYTLYVLLLQDAALYLYSHEIERYFPRQFTRDNGIVYNVHGVEIGHRPLQRWHDKMDGR